MRSPISPRDPRDFKVAVFCALPPEATYVQLVFDTYWETQARSYGRVRGDTNTYTMGAIGGHNVVLVHMPGMGIASSATVAANLRYTFSNIELALVVGICGAVPYDSTTQKKISLGDIIISTAVIPYNFGRQYTHGFERKREVESNIGSPSREIQGFVAKLQTQPVVDRLLSNLAACLQDFPTKADFRKYLDPLQWGTHGPVRFPDIHFGRFGSADTVMKSNEHRDRIAEADGVIAFEMEGAGVWDQLPTVIIKAASDYADGRKDDEWRNYAAAMAAGGLRAFLSEWTSTHRSSNNEPCDGRYSLGVNLFDTPDLDEPLFVGREKELHKLESSLLPQSGTTESVRNIIILCGMGGIGKTQLVVSFAKKHRSSYSSIFWLNATSETTLNKSLRAVANRIIPSGASELDDNQVRVHVSNWLSELDNTRWLLVFDGYDEAQEYNLVDYYPAAHHGSIIITTRLFYQLNGTHIQLRPIDSMDDNLKILATRSGRENVTTDPNARILAERLDGYPLALATAGAFLRQSSFDFAEYLKKYEATWNMRRDRELSDYPRRTLYTTWGLSYSMITDKNALAADLLRFLAYFDNQDIWYELLCKGQGADQPSWFSELAGDELEFEDAMQTLITYCLVESHRQTRSYNLHVCVHDWTTNRLGAIDATQYWLAFDCIVGSVDTEDEMNLSKSKYARLVPHAVRLANDRFQQVGSHPEWLLSRVDKTHIITDLLCQHYQHIAAERFCSRTLAAVQQAHGPSHISTLTTILCLGGVYLSQGKLDLAERTHLQALAGFETELGKDHSKTLNAMRSLGYVYAKQDKQSEAEAIYKQALYGAERALGHDSQSTLLIVHALSILYAEQGQLNEAEKMYLRALEGYQRLYGLDHITTISIIQCLGNVYLDQGRREEAEQMFQQALAWNEKVYGHVHSTTLGTVHCLGNAYTDQGKLEEAKKMYLRVIDGFTELFGRSHRSTVEALHCLGNVYMDQHNLVNAEQTYLQALGEYVTTLGRDHESTLLTVYCLGKLYGEQGRQVEEQRMFAWALDGYEKAKQANNTAALNTLRDFQELCRDPDNPDIIRTVVDAEPSTEALSLKMSVLMT